MNRLEGAQAVLDALGQKVERPSPPAPSGFVQRLCRNFGCNVQIVVAPLAGGNWAAIEAHPEGELVLSTGIAITRGPDHNGLPRYCFHRCSVKEKEHG